MSRARLLTLAYLPLVALAPACSQRELATCDITQRACQESIYYRVVNLRGDGYDPFGGLPPVTVITEDQFRATLEQEAATAAPSAWDRGLELLHFTTAPSSPSVDGGAGLDGGGSSTIDDQVAHIYAFYDSVSKTITVIAHPNQTSGYAEENAMLTLAHELVHALQDRELDLGKLLPGRTELQGSDEYLAYDAVIEGDARFYENLFRLELVRMINKADRDAGLLEEDPTERPDDELRYAYANFAELGSPLFATQYLMYPLGAKYLATAFRSGGNAAVRHAYAKAPARTVGYLVGEDGRAPPVSAGAVCAAATSNLSTIPTTTGLDEFGAVAWYAFLRGWGVAHDVAFATAQAWTGDSLRVEATADLGTTAVAWRLELSTSPPAEVARALGQGGELTVATGPNSIEVTASDAVKPLTWSSGCP